MLIEALAHEGAPIAPHDLWTAWNIDPLLLAGLVAAAWAFQRGRAGRVRPLERWRVRCFVGALVVGAVALISPLEALSGSLASAHMVQHVLLVLAAAPLLALAAPVPTLLRGAPEAVRHTLTRGQRRLPFDRRTLAFTRQPAVVWLAHVGVLWLWHASVPYDAALDSEVVHIAEHVTFLVTGVLFWRVLIGARAVDRVPRGVGVLLVFTMALQSVFLSALLTFARQPWYSGYADTTEPWGLDPLADQQLAGAIMWVPAGAVYLAAGLALLVAWIRDSDLDSVPLHTS